ncbi:NIF3-domain-containing protein [Xylona heveae TC161]|uniref:NIF3-domain-containing protein n=1 Tax=Xylona heveae (strain CBS 132557 / TC161) TaxID=1328760 RepID=A0A165G8H1_XYLHT|nr:NIF3-domain-containing protein [Xylona heveae TC161]KZF21867.1 NIF3-domain-containing protein [Xylona heveae TC161]
MSSPAVASPFTRAVVNSMRKLYPEALADRSWDNTGLLLEAPFDPARKQANSVLLTVDLTRAVADEAIERKDSIIIAYHPIIFRGLKSLTFADSQQQTLLRLAQAGISVYSPHTAVDAAPGGVNDWLADIVTGQLIGEEETPDEDEIAESVSESDVPDQNEKTADQVSTPRTPEEQADTDEGQLSVQPIPKYSDPTYPEPPQEKAILEPATSDHERAVIQRVDGVDGFEEAGMGRIIRFSKPHALNTLIERVARGLGNPKAFPIAIPQGKTIDEIEISSVGICAGSGGSLFRNLDVDLFFTGELSHHEALAAIERGQCIITLFHSNTERGFLHSVLRDQLSTTLKDEWQRIRSGELEKLRIDFPPPSSARPQSSSTRPQISRKATSSSNFHDPFVTSSASGPPASGKSQGATDGSAVSAAALRSILEDESVEVHVSERDRDPYGIVILKSEVDVDVGVDAGSDTELEGDI